METLDEGVVRVRLWLSLAIRCIRVFRLHVKHNVHCTVFCYRRMCSVSKMLICWPTGGSGTAVGQVNFHEASQCIAGRYIFITARMEWKVTFSDMFIGAWMTSMYLVSYYQHCHCYNIFYL